MNMALVPPPELRVRGLGHAFGPRTVLEGVDLTVLPGKITVIVGANASGKSTLLRAMSRLLTPKSGRVLLDGDPLLEDGKLLD